MRSGRRWAVLVVVVAAACSSTAKNRPQGLTGPAPAETAAPGMSLVPTPSGSPVAAPTGAGGGKRRSPGQPAATAGGGRAGAAGGPGAVRGPERILVGMNYSENVDAAFQAFGATRPPTSEPAAIQAVVQHLNATGGIAGRPVEAFLYGTDPLRGEFDQQAQAACTAFAEDRKVLVVVGGARLPSFNLPDCLARKGVPLVWDYQILVDRVTFDRYAGFLYQPFTINGDRLGVYVDHLVRLGYFDPGARVGLLRYDTPIHKRVADQVIKPRLAAAGFPLTEEVAVKEPSSAGDGASLGQLGNAVLRFSSAGVTHLLFVPTGGAAPFLFMNAAEGQGYRPRYGLNSLDIPNFLVANVPAAQLRRALAVGWLPASDVSPSDIPGGNPAEELCARITGSRDDEAVRYCDGLFFLKAALDRAPEISPSGLRASVERLGDAYTSPWTFATRFGPGRWDGAAAVRGLAFDEGCRCFRYTGSLQPVP